MGEMLPLSTEDGHALARYRAAPQGKLRGALVIIQEIFSVNSHIKRVTDGFAADGYVALAPAIFDRAEPDFPGARPISRSRPTTGRRAAHPNLPMHIYSAGHGFNGDERGNHHEPSATLARTRTLDFLNQYLG